VIVLTIVVLPSRASRIFPLVQQAVLEKVENEIMQTHHSNGIDADSYITEALDTEARNLARINQHENKQKLRELP
jgi:hypothetical protein